jgi:hypothetical protein
MRLYVALLAFLMFSSTVVRAIVIPKGKILDDIQNYYKKLLKQLLSLTINVADPAVYMISGLLPLEAEIHTKVFT